MIAIQPNDICFSTARGGNNPFNTDGKPRTELPVEEARTALDFRIVKKPSYDEAGRRIPSHFHLVKDTDNSFIPSSGIGAAFTPVQHLDVFEYIVNEVMPQIPDMKLEMCGTIHGGGTGLIAAKFGDTFAIPGDESPNELRLFFSNPSQGRGSMTLGFTTVRVVCQNTLLAATEEAKEDGWTIRHTKGAPEKTDAAVKCIHRQAIAALEMKEKCAVLARVGVDAGMVARVLEEVYPIGNLPDGHAKSRLLNIRNAVMEQFESRETAQTIKGDTAWKLFNSFTFPIFNPERISKRKDLAEIQFRGMTGDTAQKVRRIFGKVWNATGAYAA